MNDTAQSTQNTQSQNLGTSPSQPLSQQTTGGSKETAPGVATKLEPLMQEHLPPVELSQEVKEVGVEEVKNETLEISPDMKKAGVQPVGLATPLPTEATLKFPMSEERAQGILKMHKKVKESVTWLAMLVVRQMKMLRSKKEEHNE